MKRFSLQHPANVFPQDRPLAHGKDAGFGDRAIDDGGGISDGEHGAVGDGLQSRSHSQEAVISSGEVDTGQEGRGSRSGGPQNDVGRNGLPVFELDGFGADCSDSGTETQRGAALFEMSHHAVPRFLFVAAKDLIGAVDKGDSARRVSRCQVGFQAHCDLCAGRSPSDDNGLNRIGLPGCLVF